jgi:hypothetical protein
MTFLLIKTILNLFLIPVSFLSLLLIIINRIFINNAILILLNLITSFIKILIYGFPLISFLLIIFNCKLLFKYIKILTIAVLDILPLIITLISIDILIINLLKYNNTFNEYKFYFFSFLVNYLILILNFKVLNMSLEKK